MPLPPADQMLRQHGSEDGESFDRIGLASKRDILSLLGDDWSFEGKRVLDFGCGSGRTLRHFLAEAEAAEVHGCDIDADSIAWLKRNHEPPLRLHHTGEDPPLPFEDGSLDLVWSVSVFTHLADSWSAWMCELHRVLADDGLLVATYSGRSIAEHPTSRESLGGGWDEERAGMAVTLYALPFNPTSGPGVYLSRWWLEEHWGRAFEILELREGGFGGVERGQGVVLMRKRPGSFTPEDLDRIDPGEPREVAGLQFQIRLLFREVTDYQRRLEQYNLIAMQANIERMKAFAALHELRDRQPPLTRARQRARHHLGTLRHRLRRRFRGG